MRDTCRDGAAVLLAIGLLLTVAPAAAGGYTDAGYDEAISTLRCDCGCHPQSLKDCACGYAANKRAEIEARMVREDLDADTLVASWVAEFGEQILISPPKSGFNLVAWLGPLAALVVALAMMVWLLFRWRSRSTLVEAPAAAAVPGADDSYHDRLRKSLEELQ